MQLIDWESVVQVGVAISTAHELGNRCVTVTVSLLSLLSTYRIVNFKAEFFVILTLTYPEFHKPHENSKKKHIVRFHPFLLFTPAPAY